MDFDSEGIILCKINMKGNILDLFYNFFRISFKAEDFRIGVIAFVKDGFLNIGVTIDNAHLK